jgi:hypothetical protein
MTSGSVARRDLVYFLLGPGLASLAVAGLFHLHTWPTANPSQAAALDWGVTTAYLAVGAFAAMLSTQIGCPPAPPVADRSQWLRICLWALAAGIASGGVDLAFDLLTPWGVHLRAIDKANGYSWANVALPWSLAHYLHAAVQLECAFRLAAIVIPAWLVGRLLLKGRFETVVFWTFAGLAAWIEPLEKAILVRKLPFADMGPWEIAVNLEAVVAQLVFAWMLRRFGWPAPILMRYGYYLLVRVFAGYLYPHTAEMYPGPH